MTTSIKRYELFILNVGHSFHSVERMTMWYGVPKGAIIHLIQRFYYVNLVQIVLETPTLLVLDVWTIHLYLPWFVVENLSSYVFIIY